MKTIKIKLSQLTQHPEHKRMYMFKNIEELANSIKTIGLLEPIITNKRHQVISGWRRVLATKFLGLETILAIVRDDIPPAEEIRFIIDFNKQRIKSMMEKLNEIQRLQKLWGKKQGERTDKNPKLSNEEKKHTNERIAKAIGISTGNLYKIRTIVKADRSMLPLIDTGEISIHEAYNRCTGKDTKVDEHNGKQNSGSMPVSKMFAHVCPRCKFKFNK